MSFFAKLKTMVERSGQAALVGLVDVRGSSPREVGARMAVGPDGAFTGTIGGGALEWQALAEAQAMLARAARGETTGFRRLNRSLGPDLGQCCGGRVGLAIERLTRADLDWLTALAEAERGGAFVGVATPQPDGHFTRRLAYPEEEEMLPPLSNRLVLPDGRVLERFGVAATPVALFGSGHVGRALVLALAPLPFAVTWIDSRPDAFPALAPSNVMILAEAQPVRALDTTADGAIILIMTHSHALDLDIAMAALSARRFAFVGVIGSETKRARFASQLRQAGLDAALIGKLVCPIGIPGIEGKEPAIIAASVAAQMLSVREKAAMALQDHDSEAVRG